MSLGTRHIDDVLTFYAVTTRFDTGAATDADSAPSYRVYEEETGTPLLTGSMALLDSANTAGFYSEQITLSAANGFEIGKSYGIYIQATVNSVIGATTREFVVRKKPLTPTTEGRELDVNATGEAGLDWGNIGSPTTTVNLSGTTVKTATDVETDTADIQTRLPAALVSGRMDSNMQAAANGVITAAVIATGAVDADALATDAVNEIVDQVWRETLTDHSGTAGSTAEALGAAGSAGDPWTTALPGAYTSGQAGKIVGDNLNATVGSRSSHSAADVWAVGTRTLTSFGTLVTDIWAAATRTLTTIVGLTGYTAPDNAGITAIKAKTDNLPVDPADASDIATATTAILSDTATLLARLTSGRAGNLDNLDATISSRLAAASITLTGGKVTPIDVDGLTHAKAMEVLLALVGGVAAPSGSTVAFKKRDGTTTTITITYGVTDGERTVSSIA